MKTLLSIAATLLATTAVADVPRPISPAGPVLTQITEGNHKVRLAIPDCARPLPGRPICAVMPSVVLDLTLTLNGCLDTAYVSYSLVEDEESNSIKVIVSALNVANPKSKSVKCVAAPTALKTISLGGPRNQSKNVSVEFLQHSAK